MQAPRGAGRGPLPGERLRWARQGAARPSVLFALGLFCLLLAGLLVWRSGHRLGSGFDSAALDSAWARVNARPSDPDAWMSLGEVQTEQDQFLLAERSYRSAIQLGDPEGRAYARLGFLLYARGADSEALETLGEAQRLGADVPMLKWTVQQLKGAQSRVVAARNESRPEEPIGTPDVVFDSGQPEDAQSSEETPVSPAEDAVEPDVVDAREDATADDASSVAELPEPEPESPAEPPPPDGRCSIALRAPRDGRTYTVPLRIDGLEAELILDTGASLTLITQALANDLGGRFQYGSPIQVVTVNGSVELPTGTIGEVVIAKRAVDDVRVAVCSDCVQNIADGLLGVDLQTAFGMRIDLVERRIDFADCDPE